MKKPHFYLLYAITAVAIIAIFFINPIRQNQDYHHFADGKNLIGINNFWNVISNLPFVIIGIYGLLLVNKSMKKELLFPNYSWFFIGIFLTGFGSAYYHYNPNDTTLIWDRLPMTISFMSFFSIIIGTFIDEKFKKQQLYYFLSIGFASILYWVKFDDLKPYALVQFLPINLIILILILSHKNKEFKKYFWQIILYYIVAKILESADLWVYNHTNQIISGHSLKHLAAAVAPFVFCVFIKYKFIQNHPK
jgi:hypothetical protein